MSSSILCRPIAALSCAVLVGACGGGRHDGDVDATPTDLDAAMADAVADAPTEVDASPDGGPAPAYAVYPGCEAPATSYARTIAIDPARGTDGGAGTSADPLRTLAAALGQHRLRPGDHVVLAAGDHGAILATPTRTPELDGSAWLWVEGSPGATLAGLDLRGQARWLVTGVALSATTGNIVSTSGGQSLVIADNEVFTARDSTGWSASQWISGTATGVYVRNSRCASVLRNRISNVRFGIVASSDALDVAASRIDTLVADNQIRNFSADGMRALASNLRLEHNRVYDAYVSQADGDGNHDDGIQGFALNGASYDHVELLGNHLQETTDPGRPWNATMQGIGFFDGVYTNLHVANNVVINSTYHGVSINGASDALIEHNTAVSTDATRPARIQARANNQQDPPVNNTVRDNLANVMNLAPAVTTSNNPVITLAQSATTFVRFDPATAMFDLHLAPTSPLAGSGAGAY